MVLICEQLPDSLSEVIGSKVLHLYESHPHDKTTKDIFHSLLCVTVQSHPPHPPSPRASPHITLSGTLFIRARPKWRREPALLHHHKAQGVSGKWL